MSGGPPHHPHNRQVPATNPAWNHLPPSLQVPNFFPRQPQLAHMSNEHSLLHQPTWHTPTTTEAMKMLPHTHMFNEMLKNDALFPKDCVDLSLTRNGNQNGELSSSPISLSVRDANKINSLPASLLDIQAVELTKCNSPLIKPASPGLMSAAPTLKSVSPGLKSASPGLMSATAGLMSTTAGLISAGQNLLSGLPSNTTFNKVSRSHSPSIKGTGTISPGLKSASPGLKCDSPVVTKPESNFALMKPMSPSINTSSSMLPQYPPPFEPLNAQQKRANVRVDSILERLNPQQQQQHHQDKSSTATVNTAPVLPDYNRFEETNEKLSLSQSHFMTDSSGVGGGGSGGTTAVSALEKPVSVIVQPSGGVSCDENSNSNSNNSISNLPTRDDDTISSSNSNEDSLDGGNNKSRRKRKPCKTIRVSKDDDKLEDKLSVICEGAGAGTTDSLLAKVSPSPTEKPQQQQHHQKPAMLLQQEKDSISIVGEMLGVESKIPERRRSSDDLEDLIPAKTRRKTSSESETIDNIAAMVQDCLKEKKMTEHLATVPSPHFAAAVPVVEEREFESVDDKPISVSVIKTKGNNGDTNTNSLSRNLAASSNNNNNAIIAPSNSTTNSSSTSSFISTTTTTLITPAQKKATNTHFVEVENKLEEMFAGIEDSSDPLKTDALDLDDTKFDDSLSKLDDSLIPKSQQQQSEDKKQEQVLPLKEEEPKVEDVTSDQNDTITEDRQPQDNIVSVSSATEMGKKKSAPVATAAPSPKKSKRKVNSRRNSDAASLAETPPKKKKTAIKKTRSADTKGKAKAKGRKTPSSSTLTTATTSSSAVASTPVGAQKSFLSSGKFESAKDVYAYDSGSNASSSKSRGPYIQIKGPRDSPLSVSVVNTPINDDDGDHRRVPKSKKFHDDSEYRHKVRSKGLHSSTLSNKYDAQTKDATWICVFCKRGPHASELTGPTSDGDVVPPGDLFGPYFITNECPEFERRLDDPFDKQFKSKKITRCLNESGMFGKSTSVVVGPSSTTTKKSKRKQSDAGGGGGGDGSSSNTGIDGIGIGCGGVGSSSSANGGYGGDVFLGIVETDKKTFEIWAHEDCIVWSPGVYLVGHKIVGLEEAVWTSCNVPCRNCNFKGANICCLRRACTNTMHLCCARANNWHFDESTFRAYCPQHAIP